MVCKNNRFSRLDLIFYTFQTHEQGLSSQKTEEGKLVVCTIESKILTRQHEVQIHQYVSTSRGGHVLSVLRDRKATSHARPAGPETRAPTTPRARLPGPRLPVRGGSRVRRTSKETAGPTSGEGADKPTPGVREDGHGPPRGDR